MVTVLLGLSIALPVFSAAPAKAQMFELFPYGGSDRAYPSVHRARKHRKARHKDSENIAVEKQKIPRGPVQVVVSISRQRAYLYSDGVRVADGAISTGVPGHPTPMGVFSVIAKSRYHHSNIYSGAPMPYMQRITWSGIALHEGPLPGYPASHGCIRLTQSFAVKLWGIAKVGARVIVTREEVAPVAIDNSRLFEPKKPQEKPEAKPEQKPIEKQADATTGPMLMAARTAFAENIAAPAGAKQPDATAPAAVPPKDVPKETPKQAAKEAPKPKGPVEVFVSRKSGKLYVKQGFTSLFEAPVTITDPGQAWGTHVFTVMDIKDGKANWNVMSIPSGYARAASRHERKGSKRERAAARERERQEQRAAALAGAPTPAEALAHFQLAPDAIQRISELLTPGSSMIVSDNALSDETGPDTGFIVSTR